MPEVVAGAVIPTVADTEEVGSPEVEAMPGSEEDFNEVVIKTAVSGEVLVATVSIPTADSEEVSEGGAEGPGEAQRLITVKPAPIIKECMNCPHLRQLLRRPL